MQALVRDGAAADIDHRLSIDDSFGTGQVLIIETEGEALSIRLNCVGIGRS
jgi:hypothetical protein